MAAAANSEFVAFDANGAVIDFSLSPVPEASAWMMGGLASLSLGAIGVFGKQSAAT